MRAFAVCPFLLSPIFLHASPLNPRRIPMRHKKWTVSWYNWNNSVRTACVQKNLPIFSPLSSYITMFAVVLDTSSHFLIFKLQLGHFIIFNSGASVILYLQFMEMYVFLISTVIIVPVIFFFAFSCGFMFSALLECRCFRTFQSLFLWKSRDIFFCTNST